MKSYKELQEALKQFKNEGFEVLVKLNDKKESLHMEFDRLMELKEEQQKKEINQGDAKNTKTESVEIKEVTDNNYWVNWNAAYKKVKSDLISKSNLHKYVEKLIKALSSKKKEFLSIWSEVAEGWKVIVKQSLINNLDRVFSRCNSFLEMVKVRNLVNNLK